MIPARVLVFATILSGCVASSVPSEPVSGVPLDIVQTRDDYFANHPAEQSFALLDRAGKGFRFHRDGSLDYISFGARTNVTTHTTISEIAGNRFCMEPAGSWTGGCATVAGTLEGPISSVVIFGNGAERRVTLHLAPA